MLKFAVRGLVLAWAVAISGVGLVNASAPGGRGGEGGGKSNKTVTETETSATLAGAASQTAAKGYAESEVVTVTNTKTGTTTTNSSFAVSVKGLTLADGSIVTFQLNGTTIGTGTVKSGRAGLRLSTKRGDTVPTVNQNDVLTVVDPDGSTVDLTGTFGAPQTESED